MPARVTRQQYSLVEQEQARRGAISLEHSCTLVTMAGLDDGQG